MNLKPQLANIEAPSKILLLQGHATWMELLWMSYEAVAISLFQILGSVKQSNHDRRVLW